VAGHHRGAQAPGGEQLGQCVLEGEQRRLRVGGLRQARAVRFGEQHVQQRLGQERLQQTGRFVQRLLERRLRGVQPAAHPGVLRALAGEQEGQLAHRPRRRSIRKRPAPRLELGDRVRRIPGHHCQPVSEVGAADSGAEADVGKACRRACQERLVAAGKRLQGRARLGGERQQPRLVIGRRRLHDRSGLQQDVSDGPAGAGTS
jgi:hypothetical protein